MTNKLIKVEDIIKRVNVRKDTNFSRNPEPISVLNDRVSNIIGDNIVYLSEFVIAKIKGKIP